MPKRNGQGIELLADPVRRRIFGLVALGQGAPSQLAVALGLSRPATTRQLRLLHKAGLLSVRRHLVDGRRRVYYIEPRRLGQIAAWLAGTDVSHRFALSDQPLYVHQPPYRPPDKWRPALRVTVPLARNHPESGKTRAKRAARAPASSQPKGDTRR